MDEDDPQLAQVTTTSEAFIKLAGKCSDAIPSHLKTCTQNPSQRVFHHRIKSDERFNDNQAWFLERKSTTTPARCSGCLKKGAVKKDDLHFVVTGILYLQDKNKVVETKMRFCLKDSCIGNITSTIHNINSIESEEEISCSVETAASLTNKERDSLQGFNIKYL